MLIENSTGEIYYLVAVETNSAIYEVEIDEKGKILKATKTEKPKPQQQARPTGNMDNGDDLEQP